MKSCSKSDKLESSTVRYKDYGMYDDGRSMNWMGCQSGLREGCAGMAGMEV